MTTGCWRFVGGEALPFVAVVDLHANPGRALVDRGRVREQQVLGTGISVGVIRLGEPFPFAGAPRGEPRQA